MRHYLLVAVAALACCFGFEAKAQLGYTRNISFFTNDLPALANITNLLEKRVIDTIPNAVGVVELTLTGGNIGTSNVVMSFCGSIDGENWTTDFGAATLTFPSNGTNAHRTMAILGTNFLYKYLSMDKVTTVATNTIGLTNGRIVWFAAP